MGQHLHQWWAWTYMLWWEPVLMAAAARYLGHHLAYELKAGDRVDAGDGLVEHEQRRARVR